MKMKRTIVIGGLVFGLTLGLVSCAPNEEKKTFAQAHDAENCG